ncbi:hypothetical protein MTO96_025742 [Rhipicephalus appendiculatus]
MREAWIAISSKNKAIVLKKKRRRANAEKRRLHLACEPAPLLTGAWRAIERAQRNTSQPGREGPGSAARRSHARFPRSADARSVYNRRADVYGTHAHTQAARRSDAPHLDSTDGCRGAEFRRRNREQALPLSWM